MIVLEREDFPMLITIPDFDPLRPISAESGSTGPHPITQRCGIDCPSLRMCHVRDVNYSMFPSGEETVHPHRKKGYNEIVLETCRVTLLTS